MSTLQIVAPDFDMVVAAARLHQKYSLSLRDALIVQAAKTAECTLIVSEDLQEGFRFNSLTTKNPFAAQNEFAI